MGSGMLRGSAGRRDYHELYVPLKFSYSNSLNGKKEGAACFLLRLYLAFSGRLSFNLGINSSLKTTKCC
jgi:hypothetical protein